jgi:hypothetical protein
MQCVLLLEERLEDSRPDTVKVLNDWGPLAVVIHPKNQTTVEGLVMGRHVLLEGPEEDIKNWLAPFDEVWLGVGSPMLQEFEPKHIKTTTGLFSSSSMSEALLGLNLADDDPLG